MKAIRLFFIGLVLSFGACQDPTEGIVVHISPDFYDYAVSIQLRDLSAPNTEISASPSFTLSGPMANEVYAIDGTKNFRFNNGETALILNRLVLEPQANNPVWFNLHVETNGYRPKTYYIVINEGEFYSEELIYLLPDDPNMDGVAAQSSTGAVNSDGSLAEELNFDFATTSDTLPASFTLALDSGITFYDRGGQPISGANLEVDVVGFDTYSDNSTLALPGSSLIQFMEINGVVQRSFVGPMPRLDLNLSVNGKEVKSIQGGKMRSRINLVETTNPLTLTTYGQGDSIDIISYDEQDQYWTYLYTTVVEKDSLGKYILVDVDDFSSKSATRILRGSGKSGTVDVHIKINPSGHIMSYNDFRAEFTGNDGTYSKLINRSANSAFDVSLAPGLVLYAQVNPNNAFMVVETGSGTFSSRNPVGSGKGIKVDWNATSDTVVYTLDRTEQVFVGFYRAFCASQPNVLLYPPVGTKVYIKEAGAPEYGLAPVHIVTKENKNELRFETTAVEDGKTYDIKIRYNGEDVAERLGVLAEYGKTIDVEIPDEDCAALGI